MPRAPTFNSMRLIRTLIRSRIGPSWWWSLADRLRLSNAGCMDLFKNGPPGDLFDALSIHHSSLLSCVLQRLYSLIPSQARQMTCATSASWSSGQDDVRGLRARNCGLAHWVRFWPNDSAERLVKTNARIRLASNILRSVCLRSPRDRVLDHKRQDWTKHRTIWRDAIPL